MANTLLPSMQSKYRLRRAHTKHRSQAQIHTAYVRFTLTLESRPIYFLGGKKRQKAFNRNYKTISQTNSSLQSEMDKLLVLNRIEFGEEKKHSLTDNAATASGSLRKSACVPIKTIGVCDFRKIGAHFSRTDTNVWGWMTEKHSKNTSLSG